MAKKVSRKNIRTIKKTHVSPFGIYWEKKNYLFLFLGFALLIIGFYIMSIGSWDSFPSLFISPVILIIAYLLIFPASILYRKKAKKNNQEKELDSGQS